MEGSAKPKLLITGINGYIGAWTTLYALESGEYEVRGTVRDTTNEKKIQVLKDTLGDKFDELELVSADLLDKESLTKAADGCEYILHLASPYPLSNPKNEDEVIKPAVEGTTGILEAVKGGSVKRIVITSSCTAVMDHTKGDIDVDETSWPSNVDTLSAYYKSKIYAEKAAWDFIEKLPEEEKIEVCTINPGVVTGPLLNKGTGASQKLFTDIMNGTTPSCLQIYFPCVDVRDVADAHLKALKAEPNRRYIMSEDTYKLEDLGKIMHEEFSQYGYKVTHKPMWKSTAWLASFFIKDVKTYYSCWNVRCHVKNDAAKDILGINFRTMKESLKDMGISLIKHGFVPDKINK